MSPVRKIWDAISKFGVKIYKGFHSDQNLSENQEGGEYTTIRYNTKHECLIGFIYSRLKIPLVPFYTSRPVFRFRYRVPGVKLMYVRM